MTTAQAPRLIRPRAKKSLVLIEGFSFRSRQARVAGDAVSGRRAHPEGDAKMVPVPTLHVADDGRCPGTVGVLESRPNHLEDRPVPEPLRHVPDSAVIAGF